MTYLVDRGHALGRKDALDLGRILASHFHLFQVACHTGKDKLLQDDDSYYRFEDECVRKWADERGGVQRSLAKSARQLIR